LIFTACAVLVRTPDGLVETLAPFHEVLAWAQDEGEAVAETVFRLIHRIGGKRPALAGLDLDRPLVMGIINCTPDSFSDGGDCNTPDSAFARGMAMLEAGADILDIGGESTRPGAEAVLPEQEAARVVPVIRALAGKGAVISIDTRHALVMRAALAAGAKIINDVTALTGDALSLTVAAESGAPVILMHMRGDPRTMQDQPTYDYAPLDVHDYLSRRIAACEAAGIPRAKIMADPGIGFGKTVEHNLQILFRLGLLHGLGCGILLGVSRKSFIARLCKDEAPKERLPGSLASALAGIAQGAQVVRVHDVAETVQAVRVWEAARQAGR
ncbi:MAG: dihydropteroate synthase, partial [Rhodospirillales bacterium]|nr:dihydropteroate synthase [Rhodospirillales bacterium]